MYEKATPETENAVATIERALSELKRDQAAGMSPLMFQHQLTHLQNEAQKLGVHVTRESLIEAFQAVKTADAEDETKPKGGKRGKVGENENQPAA